MTLKIKISRLHSQYGSEGFQDSRTDINTDGRTDGGNGSTLQQICRGVKTEVMEALLPWCFDMVYQRIVCDDSVVQWVQTDQDST